MGKQIYLKKIEALFEKSPVVDFKSINRIIKEKGKSNYAKLLISNMIKRGKIKKIGKGFYTKFDDISLSVFCYKPACLGLQSALSHHNLWEQETIPVIITTRKVRRGIRKIDKNNILIRNISKKYSFGFEYSKEENKNIEDRSFYIPYSDIEKTFIDMIFFRQKISEETLKNIKLEINKKKLQEYLKVYPVFFRKKVFSVFLKSPKK
jgi:predicted transcriptional regulator of viral defense system